MAIGRISGSVLKSNLTRNGTDLAFETNLLYLDVTNSRIGIGTSEPTTALDVAGTVKATAFTGDGSGLTGINVSTNIQLVGDDSTGAILGTGETFKIAGGNNITTAVSGDTLTITGSKDINVNSISSDDSTAIQINDGLNVAGNIDVQGNTITANTGNFTNFTLSDTLTIGSQIIYAQGNNGFSVNEDFDPSNSSTQTAYHYTTGAGRETLAFTLARTGQFTDGFGIYGTAADNTFVTFGEQSNTSFEWRRGVGIRPLDLDGGTLMMRLSSTGDLTINNDITVQGSVFADRIQSSGSNADIVLAPQGTGQVVLNSIKSDDSSAIRINDSIDMAGNIVPVADNTYSLGTASSKWSALHVAGSTIFLGNLQLKDTGSNSLTVLQSDGSTQANLEIANVLTVVGDDSTGTSLNTGETFKFAGTGGISTSVSGDTLTIDGSSISTSSISEGNSSVTVADSGTGSVTITADGNTELVINDTNATFSGPVVIKDRNTIVLNDTDNSNYIALRAPASVTANNTYTFPDGYGTSGQVMSTDGAGTLSWADAGGGGGGGGSSYPNSTLTTAPGTSGNYDLAEGPAQDGDETPFEAGGTDPFGVNLGSVFDAMDPIGTTTTLDYGDSEAYVGA